MKTTQETITCILCLKICNEFKSIDGDVKHAIDVLLPMIDLSAIQGPVVCTHCEETLTKCSDFKVKCLCTQDYLVSFTDNKDNVKLDLSEVYRSKNKNGIGDSMGQVICGFCMCPVKNCLAIPLEVEVGGDVMLKTMMERCLPKMDLSIIKKPVICPLCRCSLENCFRFVTNCLMVEEKVKKYCETVDIDSKGQIEVSSLLQFAVVRDATTNEVTGNANDKGVGDGGDICKLEQLLCSDSENAIEEVDLEDKHFVDVGDLKFNNEEQCSAKNVPGCKNFMKTEKTFCDENKFEEGCVKVEDQTFLLHEEIEIKTEEPDITRFEDGKPMLKYTNTNENVSQLKAYQCKYCPFETKWKSSLNMHLKLHNSSEVTMYKCSLCSFQTNLKGSLKRHMLTHKDPSEADMHKCETCSFQTKYKSVIKKHLQKHKDPSEVIMYKCDYCSYQTRNISHLKNHLLTHKDLSEVTMYKCDNCPFQSKHKQSLRDHMVTHRDPSEVTMYKCQSCPFKTKYKSHFTIHLQKHKDPSEVTMYTCTRCSYQSINKSYLKKHLEKHKDPSEVKTYKCDYCSFRAKQKHNLSTHLLTHKDPSEVTMYKCHHCPFQTKRKRSIKDHIMLVHKDRSLVKICKQDLALSGEDNK